MLWASRLLLMLMWTALGDGLGIDTHLFQWYADGYCGEQYKVANFTSTVHCAGICSSDAECQAFTVAPKTLPRERCELVRTLSVDSSADGFCYITVSLSTEQLSQVLASTPTSTISSTSLETTDLPTSQKPAKTSNGGTGVTVSGFINDTTLLKLYGQDIGDTQSQPPVVMSVINDTKDGKVETCPETDQVFYAVGPLNTGSAEKDDQRLYCSKIADPHILTATCSTVSLGEGLRPSFSNVDTSVWTSWLACPRRYMMTAIYWSYTNATSATQYAYSKARCCLVQY
ncbi:uncharacterized protein LOC135198344 [Macrobrachium nipponense]|uniref:uncharacterized protein LOC135198344 n=1 Tax=Macrobrachium nipponense TaxID=159736 RepID=UPI0030C7B93F